MTEHTFTTPFGTIHYWINAEAAHKAPQLVFLPGLTADHRLFDNRSSILRGNIPCLSGMRRGMRPRGRSS